MTNQDWIELFFSESYEKQINDITLIAIKNIIPPIVGVPDLPECAST